jgi:hypothetical protein
VMFMNVLINVVMVMLLREFRPCVSIFMVVFTTLHFRMILLR